MKLLKEAMIFKFYTCKYYNWNADIVKTKKILSIID